MKLFCSLIALFNMIAFSHASFAGISTNGSALTLEENNVWFLGSKPIEYCIESGSYRVPTPQLREIVRQSFTQWREFFQKYGLDKKEFQNLALYRNLKVSLGAREVAVCTKPGEQLRFLFGIETNEVSRALEEDEGALALAIRGVYNHETYRNGGVIYLSAIEGDPTKLHQMVLHELGHVFGMAHDSVSVMDSKLAYQIIERKSAPISFGRIETPLWSYRILSHRPADLTFDRRGGLSATQVTALKKTLGFSAEGRYKLELTWASDSGAERQNTLVFTNLVTHETKTLKGVFQEERQGSEENYGPRVHLLLECRECVDDDCTDFCGSRAYGKTRFLDPNPNPKLFSGYFEFGSERLPATIVMKHEVKIRIFDPSSLKWWMFEKEVF